MEELTDCCQMTLMREQERRGELLIICLRRTEGTVSYSSELKVDMIVNW
jgi:hypothetical protein